MTVFSGPFVQRPWQRSSMNVDKFLFLAGLRRTEEEEEEEEEEEKVEEEEV